MDARDLPDQPEERLMTQVALPGGENRTLSCSPFVGECHEPMCDVSRVDVREASGYEDSQRPLQVALDRPGVDAIDVARALQEARVRDNRVHTGPGSLEHELLTTALRQRVERPIGTRGVGMVFVSPKRGRIDGPDRGDARDVHEPRPRLEGLSTERTPSTLIRSSFSRNDSAYPTTPAR